MKSAGPYQETATNRLRKDLPPEVFEADKRTPMRQYRNQNVDHQGYHEISDYGRIEDTYHSDRNILGRQSEDRPDEDWVARIADVIQNQFGLHPRDQTLMYRRPYANWYDRVMLPSKYIVPDFSKFSGQDDTSTMEHVSRFLVQCVEATGEEPLRVRLFPLSLSGSAFAWFLSLPPNSIHG